MKLALIGPALIFVLSLAACGTTEDAPLGAAAAPATGSAAVPTVLPPSIPTPPAARTPSTAVAPVPGPAATPPLAQESAQPAANGDQLEVRRLVLASRVVEREPEPALAPRVNEPLLAFVEAKNNASEEERLIVTFEHESGKKVGFVELRVPGGTKRYRTWARTRNLTEPGNWAAVVRSESGTELGRTAFTVTES